MSVALLAPYKAIVAKLSSQFAKAKASGDLNSYESTVNEVEQDGLRYEIRVCPALKEKRAAKSGSSPSPSDDSEPLKRQKPADPFEGPYDNDLFLGKVGQEEGGEKMVALLNKFSVVDQHFLLVTEEFQSQSSPLHPPHLLHAYLMLLALQQTGQQWICIYNAGGPVSGASQLRRHLQFVPNSEEPPVDEWTASAQIETEDEPFYLSSLPHAHSIMRLPSQLRSRSSTADSITSTLMLSHIKLLDATHQVIQKHLLPPYLDPESASLAPRPTEKPTMAYNLILTLSHFHAIPRSKEKADLVDPGMSLNAMAFAGMVLCESEEQMEAIKGLEGGVKSLLRSVGFERLEENKVEEMAMA
ncbi:APA1_2 [Phaffia rhodozyma]|uniref:APA1_2 n=1 Tax=Phaffia rhodozyma TaxID=264483 RepID=A0A0F7SX69_PHARH|nr:APA1_2 [Phaffia rhodozyma]